MFIKLGNKIYDSLVPVQYDEEGNEIWNVPNDLDQLKQTLIDTVRWQAHQKLKETDWVVVKSMELGRSASYDYPKILGERQSIRDWCNLKEAEINNATSIEELLNLDIKLRK